jgi:hypothetical protein
MAQKTGIRLPINPPLNNPAPVPQQDPGQLDERRLRQVSVADLVNQHTQATGTDLFGQSNDPDHIAQDFQQDVAAIQPDATTIMGDPTAPPPTGPAVTPGVAPEPSAPAPQDRDDAATMLNLLSDEIVRARRAGNEEIAQQLHDVFMRLNNDAATLQRVHRVKQVNPVLAKLKANLGLEKIQPVEVPWAEFTWRFAAIPAALDRWVAMMAASVGVDYWSVLKLAAGLVAIDKEPLWKVFNIDLSADYKNEKDGTTTTIPRYIKLCGVCGADVHLEEMLDQCPACGALLDPYDVPLGLRAKYAEAAYGFFQDSFGPYENLQDLFVLTQAAMPDRYNQRADLYPFLRLSRQPNDSTPT